MALCHYEICCHGHGRLTGEILFAEDDGKRLHPAGAKLMTLALLEASRAERLAFDRVKISNHALEAQKLGMRQGGNKAKIPFKGCWCSGSKYASTAMEFLEGSEAHLHEE